MVNVETEIAPKWFAAVLFLWSLPPTKRKTPPPAKNVFTENQLNIHKYPYRF